MVVLVGLIFDKKWQGRMHFDELSTGCEARLLDRRVVILTVAKQIIRYFVFWEPEILEHK